MIELFITVISVLAAVLGIVSYIQSNVIANKEFRSSALNSFNNARTRTVTLLKELESYCLQNNSFNQHLMQGFSYSESIEMLKKALDILFTDENLKLLKKINKKTIALEKLVESIEVHEKHIIEIQNYFKKYILIENLNDSIFNSIQ
ncbi:MAG: hypothetical protein A2068_06955 [Ignavibacteria bacterium GWB2_35_6b]|nr:MAG: hypothetical protein A2068_06955 [Ignavibacteria bacterium GWB2_35_6b]